VKALPARPVATTDRRLNRAQQPHRGAGRGRREPAQRRGSRDAVGGQSGPALEALQRSAVDRSRWEAVAAELELQRSDVPAGMAAAHRATAVSRTTGASERAARRGSRDPVGGEARSPLYGADARRRARAADAVDRARVDARRAQGDLERGDAGAPGSAGRRRNGAGQRGESGEHSDEPGTGMHHAPAFGA